MKKRLMIAAFCLTAFLCLSLTACSKAAFSEQPSDESTETSTIDTPSAGSEKTSIPEQSDYTVEFFSKGKEISLDAKQQEEVYKLALRSVESTDTMLNTIITSDEIEAAKENGIAVNVKTSDDPKYDIHIIISEEQGGLACQGGGSAHTMFSGVSGRLLEIAGWEIEGSSSPSASIVTDSSGTEVELVLEGSGTAIDPNDIQPVYEAAKKIVSSEENEVKLLLTGEYVNAVKEQGTYIDIRDTNNGEHITLYLPRNHSGIAVHNDMQTYIITNESKNEINNIVLEYRSIEPVFDYDPLDESSGVTVTYYSKEVKTNSKSKEEFKQLILDVVKNPEDSLDLAYPMDIDILAAERGFYAEIENNSDGIKVCIVNLPEYDNYAIAINKGCYGIDTDTLKKISDIFGMTLY